MLRRHAIAGAMLIAILVTGAVAESQAPPPDPSEASQPPQAQPAEPQQDAGGDQRGTEAAPLSIEMLPAQEGDTETAAHTEQQGSEWEGEIAKFTGYLFWATVGLGAVAFLQLLVFGWQSIQLKRAVDEAKAASKAGRLQFIATNRPHIFFHAFEQSTDEEGRIGLHIDYVNAGATDARIVSAGASLFLSDYTIRPGTHMAEATGLQHNVLRSGERKTWFIESDIRHRGIIIEEIREARAQRYRRLTCVGRIIYTDVAGAERRAGFCRTYDPDLDTWNRVKTSDYEYSY